MNGEKFVGGIFVAVIVLSALAIVGAFFLMIAVPILCAGVAIALDKSGYPKAAAIVIIVGALAILAFVVKTLISLE